MASTSVIVTSGVMRFGPPLRVKLSALSLNVVGSIGSERTTSTVCTGVLIRLGLPAPTLTITGALMAVAQVTDSEPEPTSPKKSLTPLALTVRS